MVVVCRTLRKVDFNNLDPLPAMLQLQTKTEPGAVTSSVISAPKGKAWQCHQLSVAKRTLGSFSLRGK